MLKHLVLLAGCGALGTLLRYYSIAFLAEKAVPWPTLVVNVVGSILMGLAFVLVVDKAILSEAFRPYFMSAFLGAFTTFSAFSLDAFVLMERGEWWSMFAYILSSVCLCVGLLIATVLLSRQFF